MDFVKGGIKKGETMQEFADRFYLEAQTLISLKAAPFIDVKSALLNTVWPNKNLSLALKSGIYGAHNVSELICHLLTFEDNFEVPIPTATRASQENRYSLTTAETDKSKLATSTSATTSVVASSPRTCFKCGKPGHLSRECKQTNAKIYHVGADEYNYKKKCEEERLLRMRSQKNF
ncbi:hypothetical protein DSO57_1025519 [Entomophthora muscae]|uniref:Uncharacterized protein n=1 Tax=Entomophthora muscae TaxID=34485 RepID=A0ACC2U089_9FUNG|nr:hypothetical protein DSO57_1025519 [Entomophthora muscae]